MTQVKVRDARGNFNRIVFDGTEADARTYVIANFPRLHVEPGMNVVPEADAQLDDGDWYNGDSWNSEAAKDEPAKDESPKPSPDLFGTPTK